MTGFVIGAQLMAGIMEDDVRVSFVVFLKLNCWRCLDLSMYPMYQPVRLSAALEGTRTYCLQCT